MVWSKLKKIIQNNFADSVKGSVQLYITSYGSDPDVQELYNRGWITVDGIEVVNFASPSAFFIHRKDWNASTPGAFEANSATKEYPQRTTNSLAEDGEFSRYDLTSCCIAYCEMSAGEAIVHESPMIQMLAVLDKRVGKRRLIEMDKKALHPLVRYFLDLRMEAEGF